ncbi:uncharacterized protein LOC143067060 [Mytilus galloprovincialis]|uniref:uncharacterized protein LOC143067060 n=1 Tax=Mytilus galloprovincialis TaxID=29158 RepID=UPI003F7B709A
MAMATESLCHNDPNFAVICNFWDRYGEMIGLKEISYSDLERWLEDTKQVPVPLIDLHVRLLRRIGKTSVTANRWERYIIKFCHTYSNVDAWEIEKFGYKHCKLTTKLKLLKTILEKQFDQNSSFKEKVNKLAPEDMRFQPIGRDKNGLAYWYMLDNECNLRVYREDLDDNDDETWEIVCKTRNDLAELVVRLEKEINGGITKDLTDIHSSTSNSVKSEEAEDEKKLATSDDSQDSLPNVKKDPEKKNDLKKLDEVDGVVNKKEENDDKKDVKTEAEENNEKKDIKDEIRKCDEKKDIKIEIVKCDEKKDIKIEIKKCDEKEDIKEESEKCDEKKNTKKETKECDEKKNTKKETKDCEEKKDCKVDTIDNEEKKDVKVEISDCGKEKKEDNHDNTDTGDTVIIKKEPVDNSSGEKLELKNQDTAADVVNVITAKDDNIEKADISSEEKKKEIKCIDQKELKEKSPSPNIPSSEISVIDKGAEKDLKKQTNSVNDSKSNNKSELITVKENDNDESKIKNSKDVCKKLESEKDNSENCDIKSIKTSEISKTDTQNSASDNKFSTSKFYGAICDNADKTVELTEEIKCGCDDKKGGKQDIPKNDSETDKEVNDVSDNNVRRSSRTHTTRTQSQDSQVKDNKCESNSNLENTEVLSKTDETLQVNNMNKHDNGDLEKENNKTPSKSKSKVKGKKRPLLFEDNSTEDSPTVEPESKKSKQNKKILTKKSPAKVKSSTEDTDDSDDIPLSQIKGTPKSSGKQTPKATPKKLTPKGKKGKKSEPTPTRKSSRPVKKKKFDSDEEEKESSSKSKKSSSSKKSKVKSTDADSEDDDETPLKALQKSESETEEEEEDKGGRRRSSRVKKLLKKAKKKEITPPPSSFEEDDEEEDDHSDFTVPDSGDSEDEFNPAPKGRNARRQAAIQDTQECLVEEIPNDTPCIHCHKTDRPEWLLLCDKCDDGFHTACLRPPLMIIPDGDWFCPPCEHKRLLEKLQISLKDLDIIMKKKDRLIKRKERLAFVGISLDNILKDEHKENVNPDEYEQYSPEEEEEEYYKPKKNKSFVKRSCRSRNVISYKFDEFDDMINTAIKEDLENPQPYNPGKGRSRGKDMANIYMAEGREYVSEEEEGKPSPVGGGRKKKKGRRLTNLSDEDDNEEESGDEYKCSDDTSEPPEEVEEDDDDVSDYSLDGEGWCRKGTRRSARRNARSKQYKDFVVDEEDSDYGPRRKSARSTRASTRQRRKHKEVWSEEEEEEEEETDESIDTDDLCSEDSGPTKKKKNRKEIDKKVFREKEKKKGKHSAKRRRIVDSEDEGSERSEKLEESESKSESDDSSVDIGKIKKAAKRKLSKRRYSESSSESEKSESSEPSRNRRRNIAKRVNYKAIAGSDSDATEVSEDKSGSEKDKKTKKKNAIRDDSTDTDDYYDKKSEDSEEGETTEEDEKEPVKPKKQKKDEKEDEEDDETEEDSEDKDIKGQDRKIPKKKDKVSKSIEKGEETLHKDSSEHESDKEPTNSPQEKNDTNPKNESQNEAQISISTVPDSSDTPVCQNNMGVVRPSPQYSMGQSYAEGNFTNQPGQQQFQGRSPPYGSPPQQQFSPPHSSYQSQQPGHIMRQGPPLSQNYPPQMRQVNFPVSTSNQPFTSMSTNQGTISSQPYSTMQERPQYSSQVPHSQGQIFGRSIQGQSMMRGPHPGQQDGAQMQQGIRPEMMGQMRGPPMPQQDGQMTRGPTMPQEGQMIRGQPIPQDGQMIRGPPMPQQDGQMIRGAFYPNQQMMMGGRFPNQQQMMMQGQYSSYQSGQMMRGPYPGQSTMMRGPYPNTSQQDNLRGSNQEGAVTDQNREDKDSRMKSPPSSQPGLPERPMMPGQQHSYQSTPMIRGPFPGQPHRPMARGPFYGQPERHMMPGQEGHFRPGFPYPAQQRPGLHPNQQGFPHRPLQPGQQMPPSHISGPPVSSPTIGSPPIQETNQQFFPPRQPQPRSQMSPSHTPQAIVPVDRAKDVHTDQNIKNELDQTSQSVSGKDVPIAPISAKVKDESSSVQHINSKQNKIPEECFETRKDTDVVVSDTQTSSEKDIKDQVEQSSKNKKENKLDSNQLKDIEKTSSESEKPDGQIVTELLSEANTKNLPQSQVTSASSDADTDKQKISEKQTTGIELTSGNESNPKVPKSDIERMPGSPSSQKSGTHPEEKTMLSGPLPNPSEKTPIRGSLPNLPEGSMIRGPQTIPPEGSMIRGPQPIPPEGSMIKGPQPNPPEGSMIRGPQPIPPEGSIIRGQQPNPPEGSMIRGPHPYQQGMFRGQFNEMMSIMSNQRMQFQQGSMGMPQRPNMQGPPSFVGQVPRNVIPRMRPEHMRPMNPNFQRPMYGPGPMPYQQHPGVPTGFGPRLEMGMRMPQSSGPDETKADSPSKSKMQEGSDSSATSTNEPTKAKKPRKPRQTKKEKMKAQAESKPQPSSGPNVPGQEFQPQQQPQMIPGPQYQMPISRPMHPQQGPFMRPPFDNYGMNGMNQGPPDYNQMNPGMYGPPQMMPGNGGRGFMIDNLLDKHPRVQQLEPIISHEEEEESPVEPDQQTYEGEQSPSNGEKDMDEMSDIGDIVKYVMNH